MIRSGSFIFLDGIKKDETWGSCKSGEEDEVSVKKTIAVMSILFLVITGSRLSGFTVVAKQPEEVNEGRETLTDDKPDDVDADALECVEFFCQSLPVAAATFRSKDCPIPEICADISVDRISYIKFAVADCHIIRCVGSLLCLIAGTGGQSHACSHY